LKITEQWRLRGIYIGLTLIQRQQLRLIVADRTRSLNSGVTEDLIELGLARREGDKVVATEDGQYVASLY
jgi:hypothetical protein